MLHVSNSLRKMFHSQSIAKRSFSTAGKATDSNPDVIVLDPTRNSVQEQNFHTRRKGSQTSFSDAESSNSKLASVSLFITGTTSFFTIGYHLTCLSPIIPVLRVMYNETHMNRYGKPLPESEWIEVFLPLTMSFIFIGGLFGGVGIKYLLKILSRKGLLQCSHVINIVSVLVMSVIAKLTLAHEAMIVGRFLAGVPLGVNLGLVPMILAETSTWHQQAMWQSIAGVFIYLGAVCGPVLAHPQIFGTYQLWPVVIAASAAPSVVYLAASSWIPNSPFYVLRKYDEDKALALLKKLRSKGKILDELEKMQAEINTRNVVGIRELLRTRQYRNQFIAVNALYSNYVLTGIDNINLYALQIFMSAGIGRSEAAYATIGIFVLQLVAGILGTKAIDRFGALKVNITSGVVIVIAYTVFTVSQATAHLLPSVMPFVAIAAVALFMLGWSGGVGIATFALLGELTIEPVRPTAFSYGAVLLWFFPWLVGFISPYLQIYLGAYSMTIWLGFALVFVIYQIAFLPDTKGHTVEEIQAKFK